MKVVYYQQPGGNFGDDLNPWLWPRLLGDWVDGFCSHDGSFSTLDRQEALLFYGIGTILDERLPADVDKIIFGSGFGYGSQPPSLQQCHISFVRGRHTARALGIDESLALTDPAILLRDFFPVIPPRDRRFDVAFMPHHSTAADGHWRRVCEKVGCHYIDPCGLPVETVVRQISQSRRLVTEAMHGAIVADAFRVPWLAVSSVPEINAFKWRDWCDSVDLEWRPLPMTAIYANVSRRPTRMALNRLKRLLRKRELHSACRAVGEFQLSREGLVEHYLLRVRRKLDDLLTLLESRREAPVSLGG